jgi:8-hydroxy-5-deazaflavin:NADPH oxidoreductase
MADRLRPGFSGRNLSFNRGSSLVNRWVKGRNDMKIGVIGTGNVGGALGTGWAKKGHQIIFGSRAPHSAKTQDLLKSAGSNASATTVSEAAAGAEVIVLATPWVATGQAIQSAGSLAGKVLIDTTNPVGPGFQLMLGTTSSGAEQVAQWAAGAHVVKAFNTTGFENMVDPIYGEEPTAMFICGDDARAKATVARLAEDLGFEVADTGELAMARNLEPLALVWIKLAIGQGWGRNFAFRLVRR